MTDPKALPTDSGDLLDRLHAMLTKVGITDESFVGGAQLTQTGYQKVARALRVGPDEVEILLRALRTRLSDGQSRFATLEAEFAEAVDPIVQFTKPGNADRFTYEVDYLKNVTVHDTQTGKKAFLRGSEASAVLNRISMGGDQQAILSRFAHMMESGGDSRAADTQHAEASRQTGFWGAAGAGCVVMAESTGRFLIAHRSAQVKEPNTWGTWGGAIDPDEDPLEAAMREIREEAGYIGTISGVKPLYVFHKDTFRYSNFLVIVEDEFKPSLNWENQGYEWCEFGHWPSPLHFGFKSLLSDSKSVATMKKTLASVQQARESVDMRSIINRLSEAKKAEPEPEELDEDDSFHNEIHASHGAYNFPWKVGGEHGYATARYRGRGPKMAITILSIRDSEGEPMEANDDLKRIVHEQAVSYIGQE